MMRDEADIAERSVRHLLEQGVDHVIVADNLSTDGTGDLCAEAGAEVLYDSDPAYYQADKMTRLAHMAGAMGADWIIPFDADELWCGVAALRNEQAHVVEVKAYDFIRGDWRRPYPQPFPKVAFRWHPHAQLHQGNHGVDRPGYRRSSDELVIRHYQYRSLAQLIRKVRQGTAAYAATTLPESEGAHWKSLAALTDDELAVVWKGLQDEQGLIHDPL